MTALRENLEIKARVFDVDAVRDAAKAIATEHVGIMWQRDTYFESREGRLKLREIRWENKGDQDPDSVSDSAELIWYLRANNEKTTPSRYRIMTVDDPVGMIMALDSAIGVRDVVEKRREVFLHKNVRIHLDEVKELGHFMELEAVQPDKSGMSTATWDKESKPGVQLGLLDWIMDRLGVERDHLLATSYIDLLASESSASDSCD